MSGILLPLHLGIGLMMLFASGCSSSTAIRENPGEEGVTPAEATQRLLQKQSTIIMSDGSAVDGFDVHIGRDSTIWFDTKAQKQTWVRTGNVNRVVFTDRWGGGLMGFAIGAAGGAAAGLGIGAVLPKGESNRAGTGMFVGAVAGSIGGSILGAILGRTQTYELRMDSTDTKGPIEYKIK